MDEDFLTDSSIESNENTVEFNAEEAAIAMDNYSPPVDNKVAVPLLGSVEMNGLGHDIEESASEDHVAVDLDATFSVIDHEEAVQVLVDSKTINGREN